MRGLRGTEGKNTGGGVLSLATVQLPQDVDVFGDMVFGIEIRSCSCSSY